ncbi:MAG: hypothetical protein FWE09_01815, partial [Treponema sp.]|nr:hypothetical protein [Treponema sp.]
QFAYNRGRKGSWLLQVIREGVADARKSCELYLDMNSQEARIDDMMVEVRSRAAYWTIFSGFALSVLAGIAFGNPWDGWLSGLLAGVFVTFALLAIIPEFVCSIVEARLRKRLGIGQPKAARRVAKAVKMKGDIFKYQKVSMQHQRGFAEMKRRSRR